MSDEPADDERRMTRAIAQHIVTKVLESELSAVTWSLANEVCRLDAEKCALEAELAACRELLQGPT